MNNMNNNSKINNMINPDDCISLTPEETIISMFEHTDENGVLCIPELYPSDNYYEPDRFYKCTMNWEKSDLNDIILSFDREYNAIKELAKLHDYVCSDSDAETLPETLKNAWNTYIRDFETSDFDDELISDISDRIDTLGYVDSIAKAIESGTVMYESDIEFYNEYKHITVSEAEKALYDSYMAARHADAEKRVGNNYAAYYVILSAKRLYKLMTLSAPKIMIDNEARIFAEAMAIHAYCTELETVEDAG